MNEFLAPVSMQHMFDQAVSTKISPLVCWMTSTNGLPNLEIALMKQKNF
jgi:hypothetical protein